MIHGEMDAAINVAHGRALAAEIRNNAILAVIPGAGHVPPLTHPEMVTAAMLDFLSRQVRAHEVNSAAQF